MLEATTQLRWPTQDELDLWWRYANVSPDPWDAHHYRQCRLYDKLHLDWRDPEHVAHIDKIMQRYAPPIPQPLMHMSPMRRNS